MPTSDTKRIFGTDGVRGRANYAPMTVETALALGRAAGIIFRRHEGRHRVVVGKDTRLSCYMFENALIAGLCSMGVDTLMLGPFPTPGVAFITHAYRADAGIVISASHNPYYDNGIKFFSSDGYKLPDSVEQEMEELVAANDFSKYLPPDDKIGRNTKVSDAYGRYIEFAKGTFPRRQTLSGMRIALDCANGATWRVAPFIFRELDAEVFLYGSDPDGLNINKGCGSLHPELIQKAVIENKCDVGIALDGDGDRLIMVDEKAQIIDGDAILAICARDMMRQGLLRGNRVVSTVMCNFGLVKALEKEGIELIQSAVGDRHVIQSMRDYDANLGGEQSGHMIFGDYNTTGDGMVSALQVLRIMKETESKLSDLAKVLEKYPQALVNVPVKTKPPLETLFGLAKAISEAESKLKNSGRVLVRYSGTEMICRVMVEGPKEQLVQQLAHQIASVIQQEIGC